MKRTTKQPKKSTKPKLRVVGKVGKMAMTAGSLSALAATAGTAEAVPVYQSGTPVSLQMGSGVGATAAWDVDGVGGADFRLRIGGSVTTNTFTNTFTIGTNTSTSFTFTTQFTTQSTLNSNMFFASDGQNGRGLVAPFNTDNAIALPLGFNVGPTPSPYTWGAASYSLRNAMYSNGSIGYDFNYGFGPGDSFIGFRWDAGGGPGNLNYGWARINFDTANRIVTIVDWGYDTVANASIQVGQIGPAVPEPSSLALLGLGAGGLAAWRRRKKQPAPEAETA